MGTTSQKLTYLNDTKTQLKDMINYGLDTGEKITSETTFRNYVKSLFDAFIKTMTYPDVLYNNLPKVTGEGTSLTLNNTVYAPMRVELSPSALEQKTSILPSEYTQVDYIESTGTQYIDTGIKPSSDTKIDIDFAYLDSTYNGYTALFGERGATNNTYFGLYINKTDGKLAINYSQYDGGTSSSTTISRNVKYNIKNDYGSFYLNNASTPFQNTTQTLTTSTTSVYLLEQHLYNGSAQSRGMQAKIYQCKFYEGSTLIRNFIPCYRNSDNEIGMYDLVNEVFYTNAGTGTFVKGNNSVLPNPDFPQEIHTVSGENSVKVGNKNLLKLDEFSGTFNTTTYTTMGNYLKIKNRYNNISRTIDVNTNYFKSTRTNAYDNIQDWLFTNLLPNTTYTVSCDIATTKQAGNMTIFGKSISYNTTQTNTTFATDENGEFTTSVFYETQQVSGTYIELSNIQLEKNSQATSYVEHKEQSLPLSLADLEYCKIGDYEDGFVRNSGKNLWNEQWENGYYNRTTGAKGSGNNYLRCDDYIPIQPNTTIYFTKPSEFLNYAVIFYDSSKTITGTIPTPTETQSKSFTAPANAYYFTFYLDAGSGTATYHNNIMINEGTTALPYEPYGSGEWYLKKNIGKVVLDGSEDSWVNDGGGAPYKYVISDIKSPPSNAYTEVLCDNYYPVPYNDNWNNYDYLISRPIYTSTIQGVKFRNKDISSLNDFKTWLSTHNTTVYYVLSTPTYTLLSDTLQTQLDNIHKAISYQDQTNVSQTNNDLPFVIKMSAIRDLSGIFELIQG